MPGIHVRSIGRLHWEDRDKEPTLTVPGSYWLCHKNNIYKFTFKFTKPEGTTENFPHSKELMKIIRRIIKWQPKQGQHFGTKNLLVTYNHASWTRQDKMFAKMKFCDRPDAVAFSHAFILTVKLVDQATPSSNNEENNCSSGMGGTSAKIAPANLVMPDAAAETDASTAPQLTDATSLQPVDAETTTTTNGHPEGSDKNEDSESLPTRSRLKDSDDGGTTDLTTTNVEPAIDEATAEKNVDVGKAHKVDSISEIDTMSTAEWGNVLTKAAGDASRRRQATIDQDEDSNDSSGSQSDSASLPYQYLIERDIERELLNNSRLSDKTESKENNAATANVARSPPPPPPPPVTTCDSSSICNDYADNDSKSSRKSSAKLRASSSSRQDSRDNNDAAPPPEVANLKSSDITDLVMKGLMFTIRQDNDSVTVVEQKTKLEVDEVLENSEKHETKEGDPCLLNSSLLRLEKMVTRIQDPASIAGQKHNGTSENALISFVDLADEINRDNEKRQSEAAEAAQEKSPSADNSMDTANCLSQFFNKDLAGSAFETFGKVWNENEVYHTDEEYELKDEDIVPEALVDQVFCNDKLDSANTSAVGAFEDLLMDDIDTFDDASKKEELSNKDVLQKSDDTVVLNGTSVKDTSKLPKMISNELITNDQIPAALLKSLKHKSSSPPQAQNVDSEKSDMIDDVPENNNEQSVQEKIVETEAKVESQSVMKADKETNLNVDSKEKAECVEKAKKVMEYNVKVVIQRHEDSNNTSNQENGIDCHPDSNIEKNATVTEAISDRKTRRSNVMKNSDVSNSNSSNSSTRLTRSNSKIQGKTDEKSMSEDTVSKVKPIVENSKSNKIKSGQKNERSIGTRAHKLVEKKLENQENKTLSPSRGLSRKRKRSASDQDKSAFKFCKSVVVNGSEKKDVKVKVWKLINDLQYGVRVSVERMDIKNIPR